MAYNPRNALTTFFANFARLLTFEEIAQGVLSSGQDAIRVESHSPQVSTDPTNFAPITTAAEIVLAAGDRLFIQNLNTAPLFVKRGTGASASSFNYVLQAAGANDDGTGGSLEISDYIGTVSFYGSSVRYNAWKA